MRLDVDISTLKYTTFGMTNDINSLLMRRYGISAFCNESVQ